MCGGGGGGGGGKLSQKASVKLTVPVLMYVHRCLWDVCMGLLPQALPIG